MSWRPPLCVLNKKNRFVCDEMDERKDENKDENEELSLIPKTSGSTKTSRQFLYYLAVMASVGGMLFGYDTGVISGAMIQLRSDPDQWKGVGGLDLSSWEQEMVVGIATAGAILGSVCSSWTNTWYGRRKTILGSSVCFIVGALVMGVAPDVYTLLCGRFVVGLSVGFASHTVPIYIAEVAPEDVRGMLVSINSISIVFGQVLASVVDCGFGVGNVEEGWRYMLALGGVPGLLLFMGFLYVPESPRWLISQGRSDEAERSLRLIRSATTNDEIRPEFERMETHISDARSTHGDQPATMSELLEHIPELTVGCGLQLLQQFAGINTLMYYSSTILSASTNNDEHSNPWSSDNNTAICLSSVTAFAQLVGVLIGMAVVDRVGRRVLTMWSLVFVTLALVLLGFAFFRQQSQWMAIVGMVGYLVAFGFGMSPIPWLVNAEIYPIRVRSTAISISTGVNWVANLIVSTTFLSLAKVTSTDRENAENHPDGAFWIYAAIASLGLVWVAFTLPETNGKTLEEIGLYFHGRRPKSFHSKGTSGDTRL